LQIPLSYPFAKVDEAAEVKRKPVFETPHPAEIPYIRIFYPFLRQRLVPQIFYLLQQQAACH
jgi:hypothetical protein